MSTPTQNCAERIHLADAIADRDKTVAAVAKARVAVERSEARITAAKTALDRAKVDTEKAKVRARRDAASNAETTGVTTAVRASRAKEAEFADDIEVFTEAAAQFRDDLQEAERESRRAQERVVFLAGKTAALEIPRLLAVARETQQKLVHERAALRALLDVRRAGMSTVESDPPKEIVDATTFLSTSGMPMSPRVTDPLYFAWPTHEATLAIHAYFQKLQTDAAATLPE